jgi:HPt (histidine-containing phosphotransfer) domain-containing protein
VQVEELKRVLTRWALPLHAENVAKPSNPVAAPVPAPAAATEEGPAFDPAAIQELRELMGLGDQDFLDTIIKPFVATSSENIQKLRQALQQNDAVAADRAAHSIKGSAGTVGAKKFSKIAAHIMELARKNQMPRVQEEFPALVREFVRVKSFEETLTNESALT